ncbi:MAG: DNA translocase FtsK [Patescibacteria group bacterium]|nr:DNA translocase FtsK [Patescibacteria group bacterium]MDP4031179.1 DNA translocase FtsK [Candidatus Beckwithbacteria bacterium]MDZ4229032.1 DNA translocase FtsK [Patescibacteria group bacterium]
MSRHSRRGRRKEPFKMRLPKETLYTLVSTGLILASGLTLLSLSQQGALLVLIFNFFNALFGWGILLLPFIFLSCGLMLTRLKWRITKPNVFVGSLILWLSGISLTKAGTIGSQIWNSLAELIFSSGAILVLLAGVFVGLVVMLETSLEDMLLSAQRFYQWSLRFLSKLKSKQQLKLPLKNKGFTVKGLTEEEIVKPTPAADRPAVSLPVKAEIISNQPNAQQQIWHYPPTSLLSDVSGGKADRGDVNQNAQIIKDTLDSFGIRGEIKEVNYGPAVTQYALKPAIGTKLSKITSLQNDLALALSAPHGQIRIEAPIPGRDMVGIEVPNLSLEIVAMKKMLESKQLKNEPSKLTFALGMDVAGQPVIADIDKMPHVLIAGATGSGKSVCINSIISTVLFRTTPQEVKLILVDPKRVELTVYNDVPHLLTPVIVEPEKVVSALKWAISEMDRRYKIFAEFGARNIAAYNELSGFQALPYILIIIDELADIILHNPSDVEDAITRLAQMARATGIHLVLATQRPSVDVLTGLIKANINCRISFNVNSMVDSRVIIDMPGAEKLLGRGDMLFIPPDQAKPSRIQGTFISDADTKKLIEFLKKSSTPVEYTEEVTQKYKSKMAGPASAGTEPEDELFTEAVRLVVQYSRASASLLQRRLSIGYARAARIIDQLERAGVVGPGEGAKARDILVSNADTFLASRQQNQEQ